MKKFLPVSLLSTFLTSTVSAYSGFSENILIISAISALSFSIVAIIFFEKWYISFIAAMFWLFSSFASSKIIYFTNTGERITFMDTSLLTLLFGSLGVFFILLAILGVLHNIEESKTDVTEV